MEKSNLRTIERAVNMIMAGVDTTSTHESDTSAQPTKVYLQKASKVFARQLVTIDISPWRDKPIPTFDKEGKKIDSSRDKLWALNDLILKDYKTPAMTFVHDQISRDDVPIPDGVLVFESLNTGLELDALLQLIELYKIQDIHPTKPITNETKSKGLTFLYFSRDPPIYMPDVLRSLETLGYTYLLEFITKYSNAIKHSLGATEDDMAKCSLTFVRYAENVGLVSHIDGIKDFSDTFGPIFTIAMNGAGYKKLDLLPVATDISDRSPPVRLFTEAFQITMLQGRARAAYAHSIPFDNPTERYTIAFKFPALITPNVGPEYYCDKLKATIPTVVMKYEE